MAVNQVNMPVVDAQKQDRITDEQAQFFLDNGFLVIHNVMVGEELQIVQEEMAKLYQKGVDNVQADPDYMYAKGGKSGKQVLRRIEYVIDKSDPMKVLLGHPFILKSVEKLQGNNLIPTWDSMVLKAPDEGIIVDWHRDSAGPEGCTDLRPIFNVDFYLDEADLRTCLWVIPASHKWPKEQADERCSRPTFEIHDAIPVPMQPGDVIFHNILLLHGSPAGDGNPLRRTIYYEFRPGEIEADFGPHTLEYLSKKQQVLFQCIKRRKETSYGANEDSFEYKPAGRFAIAEVREPETYRYTHQNYFIVDID